MLSGCRAGGVRCLLYTSTMEVVGPNTRGDPFLRCAPPTPPHGGTPALTHSGTPTLPHGGTPLAGTPNLPRSGTPACGTPTL